MRNDDFVVRFAGEGGGGLVTSAELLAQVTAQVGYHVKTYVTFPSQIMGGPTFAQARISTSPVLSYGDELHVLVAFDREAYDTHFERGQGWRRDHLQLRGLPAGGRRQELRYAH